MVVVGKEVMYFVTPVIFTVYTECLVKNRTQDNKMRI